MTSGSRYKIIYEFTLKEGTWDQFLALQRRAHAIYSKYVSYELEFVRSEVDPNEVKEIQTFANQTDAKKIENLHEKEPDLAQIFQSFLKLLDPSKGNIETTVGESFRL